VTDSLICQAYYNKALTIVLNHLIVGDSKKNSKQNEFAPNGGKEQYSYTDGDFSNVKTSNLYHVPVPEEYVGKKYIRLFDHFTTRRHMIPLGLYRTDKIKFSQMNAGDDKNQKKKGFQH
jgi:hypothetical protein